MATNITGDETEAQQNSASKQGNTLNWVLTIATIIVTGFLFWHFVFSKWNLVENTSGLVTSLIILIVLSFVSSAVEAAYATTRSQVSLARDKFQDVADKSRTAIQSLHEKSPKKEDKLIKEVNHATKLFWRILKSFYYKSLFKSSSQKYAPTIVGAYAILSVVLNTLLAIFLPLFLVQESSTVYSFTLLASEQIPITEKFLFLAIFVTFSVLVCGKVIPKACGLKFPHVFIKFFFFLTIPTLVLCGWMSRGLTWWAK